MSQTLVSSEMTPHPDPTLLTTAQLHREVDLVKEFINAQMAGIHREMSVVRDYNDVAIGKSEKSYEKRFESVNEFRAQMADQAGKFMTAVESRAMHAAAGARIDELMRRLERSEGTDTGKSTQKSEIRSNIVAGLGIISALVMLMLFLLDINSKVNQNTLSRIKETNDIVKHSASAQ
jgi:hypothetical protein